MSSVRISVATPEADLAAAVWPGLEGVYYPRAECGTQMEDADRLITTLEKRRGIRPGTVNITALVESSTGVTRAREIAASSSRVTGLGVGPQLMVEIDGDALDYARAECELAARACNVAAVQIEGLLD